jgi:uncharacterized protein (DUF1810 family)
MTGFDLRRFVAVQQDIYPQALAELKAGHKQSHWMWFIFPQLAGLGTSPMAVHYALGSAAEARAYLGHPLLGARLRESVAAMLAHKGARPEAILGGIDATKFRASLTLFEAATDDPAPFAEALDAFYHGERDARTLALLSR